MKKKHPGNAGKLIRLSKSCISKLEVKNVSKILFEEYLGMGKEVDKFEKNLIKFFKNKKRKIVTVSSGTAALQLALQALELKPNDEVLVPSLTYLSSFQSISAKQIAIYLSIIYLSFIHSSILLCLSIYIVRNICKA